MPDASSTGLIFDIERFAIYDGPGIRATVFFKGCPLRCAWCQNPEGINPYPELLYHERLCVLCGACAHACRAGAHSINQGRHAFLRGTCVACGRCADVCPSQALSLAGRTVTVDEVLDIVLRDRAFYEKSNGGITLSGGEAMMQVDFARDLLRAARQHGLHTAVDTSGFAPWAAFETVLPYTNLFLYDVKDTDPVRHSEHTGGDLDFILDNLHRLGAAGARIWVRSVIVPGVNNTMEHFERLSEIERSLRGLENMEILPYHRLGLPKWRALGRADEAREFGAGA